MPRDFSRTQRVGDQIQRELAQLLQFELKDPRVGMVTINSVDVSRDFGYANVYVTVLDNSIKEESAEGYRDNMAALNQAAGYLRSELAHRIKLRHVPALRFHYDASVARGRQLEALIDRAVAPGQQKDG